MLIVEYAKYGNLRDYLRRKRPPGHVLSGLYESPSDYDKNEQDSIINDDDDSTHSLATTGFTFLLFTNCIRNGIFAFKKSRLLKNGVD